MTHQPKILIVDDQLSNLAFLDMLLLEQGYATQLARSGEQALLSAQTNAPDLILLDVTMPGWDGYETCRQLKQDPKLAKVPVLFLSARDNSESRIEGFRSGGVDYINKPFEQEELLARVKTHVDLFHLREHLEHEIVNRDTQLVEYANTLERKVEERTAELLAAKEEAEAGNRAKSQFLATMSHELRTPMNAIIGYSEMLLEEEEDSEKQEDLNKIHSSAKHLLGLINDVLDLSKVESGKMELYLEEFAVQDILNEIEATAAPLMEKNNNCLKIDVTEDIGNVYVDRTKCRQILLNFLSNAAKFTKEGVIELTVQRDQIAGKDWLCMRIQDQGIGMTEEQQKKLFRPFSQADASTTRRYGGTGLGLAITKQFVDMMGGTISVHSVFGEGSTFTVNLPVRVTKQIQPKLPDKEELLSQVQGGVVLVVAPEPGMRQMLKNYLSHLSYSVALAPSGKEGLRLALKLRPDAIVLDVDIPDMDGWKMATALKSNSLLADIPVFMLALDEVHNVGGVAGATDYLVKPASEQQLAATLKKYGVGDKSTALIMVVDDDRTQREIVAGTLKAQGWRVFQAENGAVALEHVASKQPDLILLDLNMPQMDGFEFVERMHENARWRKIPVVVMTSMDLTAEEYARLSKHVRDIHSKNSVTPADLLPELQEMLAPAIAARLPPEEGEGD